MEEYYVKVDPVIIYPPCIKAGKEQDCPNCEIAKKGGCGSPRAMCCLPYKNHPKGCPNYGKRKDCPPFVPMFDKVFDMKKPIFAIFSIYDLKAHTDKMSVKHPNWTETQLRNVLYWQGSARKELKEKIAKFTKMYRKDGYFCTTTPEAMGVNVTLTLKKAGIDLEWPARNLVYKVAFAGVPLSDKYMDILK